ncbi:MAG: ABC transporter ATP-binding protein [Gemmatimonadetes bacterium]|nr:ABC transporter ATP-binding protein [Gemmatimonadota bacterium]
MIQLDGVTRVYGTRAAPVRAVDGISLEIGPGVTAVVGPNGAGKTTLLGLILGFLRPGEGSVTLGGRAPRRWIRKNGAAYLPERFVLPPEWTVGPALRGLARLEGFGLDEAASRVAATLDRLGLAEHENRAIGTLSRGMNQRLGLAQALLADRELIVLDEPTEGLDPLWRVRLREIVADLRAAGRTVLLASHELPEIERVADRVVVLRNGRIQEIVELAANAAGPVAYRLDVTADDDALRDAFPDARRDGDAVVVTVSDARELSDRLAALLARGATLRAVRPAGAELEERVRRAGGAEADPGPGA